MEARKLTIEAIDSPAGEVTSNRYKVAFGLVARDLTSARFCQTAPSKGLRPLNHLSEKQTTIFGELK